VNNLKDVFVSVALTGALLLGGAVTPSESAVAGSGGGPLSDGARGMIVGNSTRAYPVRSGVKPGRFAVISDTQIPRALNAAGQEVSNDRPQSRIHNQWQATALTGRALDFVTFNGDLTEYGHGKELGDFKEIYVNSVNIPKHYGLGNHDYANNVGDCANNGCARDMVKFLAGYREEYPDMDLTVSQKGCATTFTGSLAYSYTVKGVKHIQLNNYPTYTTAFTSGILCKNHFDIRPSTTWLRGQLDRVPFGTPVVLHMHDVSDHWVPSQEFRDLIAGRVGAIFAGHNHRVGRINESSMHRRFGDVPVYFSGSPIYNTYLEVDVSLAGPTVMMTVSQMSSRDGVPSNLRTETPVAIGSRW